jgi:hypothetical protein
VRPATVGSISLKSQPLALQLTPNASQIVIGKEKRAFTFDDVFPPEATQEQVYNTIVLPLIPQFLQGFNATIFT